MELPVVARASVRIEAGENPSSLKDMLFEASGRRFRRINRFTELALLGVYRCIAELPEPPPPETALIMASDFGPVAVSVDCLKAVHGSDSPPKPVDFINVSSNMASFYVAEALGLRGSNLSVSRGADNFDAALELARIEIRRSPGVLVGIVNECAWPIDEHRRRMMLPPGSDICEHSDWLYISK